MTITHIKPVVTQDIEARRFNPNVTADDFPGYPHLSRLSPSAREQLNMPPEAEPLPTDSRRQILATCKHDPAFAAALGKLIGGQYG